MAYVLDALIVGLFALMVWIGHRRGFIKTVSGVVAFVAALVLSSMLAGPVSGFVYDSFVEPTVLDSLNEQIGDNSPGAEALDAAIAQFPAFITNRLAANGLDSGSAILATIGGVQGDETAAESITRQVVQPVALPLLKSACMLLLFLLLLLLATLLLKAVDLVAKLPLLKQLNKGLGAVAGVALGALWVFFAVTLLQLVANAGWLDFLTPAVLEETMVLRWVDSINPMTSALREIIAF